jgi:hypothetical protein
MATANVISAEEARRLFSYNPDSGEVVRAVTTATRAKAGDVVGSFDLYGYKTVRVAKRSYKLHRLIWLLVYGRWPAGDVDHINGIRDDNRLCNLRDVTRQTNLQNQRTANGRTGLLGAYFDRRKGTFYARISMKNKAIHLGTFNTPEEAHAAYINAKRQMHAGCTI